MKNLLREKLQSSEKVLGTFFEIGGATAVECLGIAGLDFLVIDTEHGPFDVESTMDFVRAAELRGITPFVRVKDTTRPSILKMLDIGAMGLIVPCVNSVDEVRRLVEYAKYCPLGRRGFAMTRSASFGFAQSTADIGMHFEKCNRETMLIPQCETMGALENIGEIAAIDGVDGIFVGPYDLSVALGKPAQLGDPEVTGAIAAVLKACKAAGKFSFIYSGSRDGTKKFFSDGFDGVAYNMDAAVYIQAYKDIISELKPACCAQ